MSQEYFSKSYAGSAPENYHKYFVPIIGKPLAIDLIEIAAIRPGDRVLDVACGTGVVARLAAERVGSTGRVAGLDLNPGMIAIARSVTPSNISIDWYEASADQMPLEDERFDVVLCQLGLMFFPDKTAGLREMRRVLAPGGRLAIRVVGPTPDLFVILDQALARHISPEAKAFLNAVFSLHDTDKLQQLVSEAGFREVQVQTNDKKLRLPAPEEFLWQYIGGTPLAEFVAQVAEEKRTALANEVIPQWRNFIEDGALILQIRDIVVTAKK